MTRRRHLTRAVISKPLASSGVANPILTANRHVVTGAPQQRAKMQDLPPSLENSRQRAGTLVLRWMWGKGEAPCTTGSCSKG